MKPNLVLNECSLSEASDVRTARERMEVLVKTIRTAMEAGADRGLRCQEDFNTASLAPEYPLSKWRNDRDVDRELRRYVGRLITYYPFLKGIEDQELLELEQISEFRLERDSICGLGMAYLLSGMAVSFASEERWEQSNIDIIMDRLSHSGEIVTETVAVVHASREDHVIFHKQWFQRRNALFFKNGNALLEKASEVFPHLEFSDESQRQLRSTLGNDSVFRLVVGKLEGLERYCNAWSDGPFDPSGVPGKVTPESAATLDKFGAEHTFRCPDGERRTFSWHVRVTKGDRIYFFPDKTRRQVIIGHVGAHLPTVKHPD